MALSAKEKQARYRKRNLERARKNDRRWRKNNLEKARAKNRDHYWDNREDMLAKNKAYYPGYYEKNKEEIKAKRRNAKHGITQEWYDEKMVEQDNRCALCNQFFTDTPHVDHSHGCCNSSKSCSKCCRGLLCKDCNLGLGRFKDDIAALERAIQYLKRYENGLASQSRIQATRNTLERTPR